jgi:CheY-like chemotaxis protein
MLTIVLVDDALNDLGFAERVLRRCKILNPIKLLHSGNECISHFSAQPPAAEEFPVRSLVFLDLVMAPISGISALTQLRTRGLARDSVFIMLSGITDIKLINEGYKLGAQTFLIKPIRPEDVLDLLNIIKNKITVRETTDGYLLEWVTSPSATPDSTTGNTDFLNRPISISA